MSKLINCECGQIIRAGDDDELVTKVDEHINEDHPDLVGRLTREDVLNMAEER
jgi:predicted small metal-binding protein